MYRKNIIKGKKFKKEYKHILNEMTFIGITGTNGKTTTTTLIYKYLRLNNINVTLIGTNGVFINDEYYESNNTTPGIEELYNIIIKSYNSNIRIIVMEVSSHAIKQHRIYGIKFYIKALTNITTDHLDFHKSFKEYKKIKISFLNKANILINDNIKYHNVFCNKYKFGKKNKHFKFDNVIIKEDGVSFYLNIFNNEYLINSNLLGEFNCYNITLFISIIYLMDLFDYNKINHFLSEKIQIPGRMEKFIFKNKNIIVDYAHTPDGFKQVLTFVKEIYKNKIITIFGCGGNRDKYKREVMGRIASLYSDFIIITSDNPRDENPLSIISDIKKGIFNRNYIIESDRKKAINVGINMLDQYNVLLILGRGNEKYNIIKDKKILFNDIDYIKELINE